MKERYFPAYTIGEEAFLNFNKVCCGLGEKFLVVGGETALAVSFDKLMSYVDPIFCLIDKVVYGKECSDETIGVLYEKYRGSGADFIVGVGGGKALDTSKCLAAEMGVPIVTAPTIASTCAACSALSVVYTKDHVFKGFRYFGKPPYHTFIDTSVIAAAPYKFLRAGVGDTLAKYYEVEFSARGREKNFSDELGISISSMCNTPLFSCAKGAIEASRRGEVTQELEKAVLIIVVSTGMVSMLINEDFNGAVAHALFYGLTNIEGFEEKFLHGDVVGYCAAVQLILDNNLKEAMRVRDFLRDIEIETTLFERGIRAERNSFEKVLSAAVKDPDMKVIPYEITKDMLFDAIVRMENL